LIDTTPQREKVETYNFFKPSCKVIVLKFVQFSNTQPSYCDVDTSVFLPKSVTLPGISINVSEIQLLYLLLVDYQYYTL
jgi:hypothetical protein